MRPRLPSETQPFAPSSCPEQEPAVKVLYLWRCAEGSAIIDLQGRQHLGVTIDVFFAPVSRNNDVGGASAKLGKEGLLKQFFPSFFRFFATPHNLVVGGGTSCHGGDVNVGRVQQGLQESLLMLYRCFGGPAGNYFQEAGLDERPQDFINVAKDALRIDGVEFPHHNTVFHEKPGKRVHGDLTVASC
jgi:hypothetical protein